MQVTEAIGRSERIRTSDPLVPNEVRYQAALHSDTGPSVKPRPFSAPLIARGPAGHKSAPAIPARNPAPRLRGVASILPQADRHAAKGDDA
jgi:hypothetical protein